MTLKVCPQCDQHVEEESAGSACPHCGEAVAWDTIVSPPAGDPPLIDIYGLPPEPALALTASGMEPRTRRRLLWLAAISALALALFAWLLV